MGVARHDQQRGGVEYGFDPCGSFLMSLASPIRRSQVTDDTGSSSADGRRQSGRKDEAGAYERTASIRGCPPMPAATALLEHIDLPVNDFDLLAAIGPDPAEISPWHHALVSRQFARGDLLAASSEVAGGHARFKQS